MNRKFAAVLGLLATLALVTGCMRYPTSLSKSHTEVKRGGQTAEVNETETISQSYQADQIMPMTMLQRP